MILLLDKRALPTTRLTPSKGKVYKALYSHNQLPHHLLHVKWMGRLISQKHLFI